VQQALNSTQWRIYGWFTGKKYVKETRNGGSKDICWTREWYGKNGNKFLEN
jgi:hypothetical protein